MYFISGAGFTAQHLASEFILASDSHLRDHPAPLREGWLAFNLALSAGYALAPVAGVESDYGDVGGSARYLEWGGRWAPWVGRGSKASLLGLALAL